MKIAQRPRPTREFWTKVKVILKIGGPGLITGAADDDPSGIGTYTLAGAQFGTAFLWLAVATWPLMAGVQMACAHIGMATGEGLGSALAKKFPRPLLTMVCVALFFANTLNVGADLVAMADCAEMLTGISSHFFMVFFGVGIALATIFLTYARISAALKWLAVSLLAYILTAFIEKPDWPQVLYATFVPHIPQTGEGWGTLVAILGTTISPYLFYWQAALEVEEKNAVRSKPSPSAAEKLFERRMDVGIGTFLSNTVMFFVILSASLTLNRHGLTHVETSREAATALVPLAGRFASLLFTFGLLGVGILAIPTLTGSAAYAFAETFRWKQGLDQPLLKAKAFYAVIIVSSLFGVLFDVIHISPLRALYWSAVANGLLAPFLLFGIFQVMRDAKLMRGDPAPAVRQVVVFLTMILMFGAAAGMILL